MTGETDPGEVVQSRHRAGTGRPQAAWLLVAAVLAAIPALAACSGASHSATGAPRTAAVSASCSEVGTTLSDGPDPGADPVGYAEAQIHPLRAIRTSDPALGSAIRALAAAYANVFAHGGNDVSATRAISAASKKINAICPGAAS
jgi:hypothetical protein